MSSRKVILDTDIGSDVDDILALTLLLREPTIDLIGVITVYGDTLLRARLAKRQCELLDRTDVKVFAGQSRTLSGRDVWWTGHEGAGMPGLDQAAIETSKNGVTFLVESATEHTSELEILAIGPLTNIATAIMTDDRFARNVKHLHLMAGDFRAKGRVAEHNVKCDVAAADIVMRSGIPITAYGLNVTTKVPLQESDRLRIKEAGHAGQILAEQIFIWRKFKNSNFNYLHDPLAALGMIGEPSVCKFQRADCIIDMSGEIPGETSVIENPTSNFSYAVSVDAAVARNAIVDRICACREPPPF